MISISISYRKFVHDYDVIVVLYLLFSSSFYFISKDIDLFDYFYKSNSNNVTCDISND